MLDIKKIKFMSEAGDIARKLNASIDADGGDIFVEKIYSEYQEVSKVSKINQIKWLKQRLEGAFMSMDQPPNWIEEEPAWAYYGDQPMIFISQTELKKNQVTEEHLTYDQTLYLFGIRVPISPDSFEMKYITVSQLAGF